GVGWVRPATGARPAPRRRVHTARSSLDAPGLRGLRALSRPSTQRLTPDTAALVQLLHGLDYPWQLQPRNDRLAINQLHPKPQALAITHLGIQHGSCLVNHVVQQSS